VSVSKAAEKVRQLGLALASMTLIQHEVQGLLRGYDQLVNLVLDDAFEHFSGAERKLGMAICRGTTVMMVCPQDGFEEIANPFLQEDDET
jgi:hypothetical protein